MNRTAPRRLPNSPSGKKTVYETSAGGVVLRHIRGAWQVAIIEPNIINADTITRRAKARPEGTVFALPKGGVDEGETPEQSADREVFEETGVRGTAFVPPHHHPLPLSCAPGEGASRSPRR